jgi:hypothetical protein
MQKWKLYWVESDGYEDCFIVAKNSQSARAIEKNTNGFENDDLTVTFVMDVPEKYEKIAKRKYLEWHKPDINKGEKQLAWPWYAEDWLLKKLGAQFRTIDNKEQILLRDVVYSKDEHDRSYTYTIGAKAINERNPKLFKYDNYDNEPATDIRDNLYTAIGLAMNECHEIEALFSNAFIFGMVKDQKKSYETYKDFMDSWAKKTLGSIVTAMQESFEIDDEIKRGLLLFVDMRNQLTHGIMTSERYDINTDWGQRELLSFIDLFLTICPTIKEIAASCVEVSISLYNSKNPEEKIPIKEDKRFLSLFKETFKVKADNKGGQD